MEAEKTREQEAYSIRGRGGGRERQGGGGEVQSEGEVERREDLDMMVGPSKRSYY